MTKDSTKSAKEKSHSEKVEFVSKIKEIMEENEVFKTKLDVIEKEKIELESLVEFMKNAGYN